MATKLKNLKITKVDFVDDGANPEAHIKLYKSKDGTGEYGATQMGNAERKPNFWKRLLGMIEKAAESEEIGADDIDEIQKSGAVSFGEKANEMKNRKIADEIWDLCYALQSSLCSIINDEDLDGTGASTAMSESLAEFDEVLKGAIASWSAGKSASIVAKETTVTTAEMDMMKSTRERLDKIIEKSVVVANKGPEENHIEEPKGAEEMKIDKTKLTPAERAFLEDIEKRCGDGATDDGAEDNTQIADGGVAKSNTPAQATQADGAEDIYKGVNPLVRAELEELKKFREGIEEKELREVAKRYAIIGKKEEDLLPVLKSLKAAGGTAYNDMISVLDQAVETVEKSGTFTEIGKSGGAATATVNGEAWAQAEVKAAEIMKSKNVTKSQALDEVFQNDPELAKKCEEEA